MPKYFWLKHYLEIQKLKYFHEKTVHHKEYEFILLQRVSFRSTVINLVLLSSYFYEYNTKFSLLKLV